MEASHSRKAPDDHGSAVLVREADGGVRAPGTGGHSREHGDARPCRSPPTCGSLTPSVVHLGPAPSSAPSPAPRASCSAPGAGLLEPCIPRARRAAGWAEGAAAWEPGKFGQALVALGS